MVPGGPDTFIISFEILIMKEKRKVGRPRKSTEKPAVRRMGNIGMEYTKEGKSPKSIGLTQTSSRLLKEMERRTLMGERKKRSNLLEDVNLCEENDYEIQRLYGLKLEFQKNSY